MVLKKNDKEHKAFLCLYLAALLLILFSLFFYIRFVSASGEAVSILQTPVNNSYSNNLSQLFFANETSTTNLASAKFYLWDSSGTLLNSPPIGNMWAVDGNYYVLKITPTGSMTSYALPSSPSNSVAQGIAFDGTNMWTANSGTNSVSKITPIGVVTTYHGTGLTPSDITFDGTNMWTANSGTNSITKIYPNGTMVNYSTVLFYPSVIEFDGTNLWVATKGPGIEELSTSGVDLFHTSSNALGSGNLPSDMTFDGENIWISCYNYMIVKVYLNGTYIPYPGLSSYPRGLASDGVNIWTTTYGDKSVSKVSPNGTITNYGSIGTVYPSGIAFDGVNMWAATGTNLVKITPSGSKTTYSVSPRTPGRMVFDGATLLPSSLFWKYLRRVSGVANQSNWSYTLPSAGTYHWSVYTCDVSGKCAFSANNGTITIDQISPVLNINGPSNNSLHSSTVLFNATVFDNAALGNLSIYLDGTLNETNNSGINDSSYNFNVDGILDGTHDWYMRACDAAGNCINSSSRNFTVDTSAPSVSLIFPSNGIYTNQATLSFISNETDNLGLGNVTIYLWDSLGLVNFSNSLISGTNNQTGVTFPLVSDGNYFWNSYVCDAAGNCLFNSTNRTAVKDGTDPIISVNYPANNTNYSSSSVSFSAFASDNLRLQNVSVYVDGSLNNTNSSGTNGTNYAFSILGTGEGSHSWYARACDRAGNCIDSSVRKFLIDTTPPVTSISSPQAIYYGSNVSLLLNYSVSDLGVGVDSSWYNIQYTNGTSVMGNTTLLGNTTFNVPGGGNYALRVWSNDTLGNTNYSEVDFSVSLTGAIVVLNGPLSNLGFSAGENALLNFTASGPTIVNCSIYTNSTGTWALNKTFTSVTSAVPVTYSLNLSNNTFYLWNVNCFDNLGHSSWALNNETFVVDNETPFISNLSITTASGSKTISLNSVESDNLRLGSCFYTIYNSTGGVDGSNNNVTFTCNSQASATVTGYGNYNITVYVKDLAGNLNFTKDNFTTVAPVTTPVTSTSTSGGGGGAAPATTSTTTDTPSTTSEVIASASLSNVNAGVPSNFELNSTTSGITSFTVTTNQNISNASVFLLNADSLPQLSSLKVSSSGMTYSAFEVNLSGINDSQISNVIINFRVNKSWIGTNNISPLNVSIYRNPGNDGWTELPTTFIGNDSQYYYFSALSPGFSIYAIFAKGISGGSVSASINKTLGPFGEFLNRITPTIFKQTSLGFILYYLLIVLVLGGIVFVSIKLYQRVRKKPKKVWKKR